MKKIIIIALFLLPYYNAVFACSMFKITKNGKTIVGNNEDWISANSEIWFEPAKDGKYGVAYVGFLNHFPQGAMNEAGLVFDAFVTDYLPVEKTKGKEKVTSLQVTYDIMRNLENVRQVKAYFERIDLSYMAGGIYMFVDKTGEYLIVEGDILTIGNDPYYLQSNFIPSQNPTPADVKNVNHYQNGLQFIANSIPKRSMDYCASVMKSMQQETTQYTSIYDLDKGVIELYHYHNYETKIQFNLKEELQKSAHSFTIPRLFTKQTEGLAYYTKYNDTINPTVFIKNLWEKDSRDKVGKDLEAFKQGFAWVLTTIGYEWLNDKNHIEGAIAIFKYGTELFPKNAKIYNDLGKAYWKANNRILAIKSYKKSLTLNPNNDLTIKRLKEVEKFGLNELIDTPKGWRKEIIYFPLPFAKSLPYKGVEEIKFAKAWSDTTSEDFWTYTFVWHIENNQSFDEIKLQNDLEKYFNGIMYINEKDVSKSGNSLALIVSKRKDNYIGKIKVYDAFFSKENIVLNVTIDIKQDANDETKYVLFKFSKKDFGHAIWEELKNIKINPIIKVN
ncbi:MAG: tetratricopeptide repeat protein [Winogradskyella sp.]|nr:MAG: tetratricopeptide repeat protein [Winogradskyella sp.]